MDIPDLKERLTKLYENTGYYYFPSISDLGYRGIKLVNTNVRDYWDEIIIYYKYIKIQSLGYINDPDKTIENLILEEAKKYIEPKTLNLLNEIYNR